MSRWINTDVYSNLSFLFQSFYFQCFFLRTFHLNINVCEMMDILSNDFKFFYMYVFHVDLWRNAFIRYITALFIFGIVLFYSGKTNRSFIIKQQNKHTCDSDSQPTLTDGSEDGVHCSMSVNTKDFENAFFPTEKTWLAGLGWSPRLVLIG